MGKMSTKGRLRVLVPVLLIGIVAACGTPTRTEDAVPQRFIETPRVTQAAQDKYGESAEAAYHELAEFSLDEWLVPAMLHPQQEPPAAQQLSDGIAERLTTTTLAYWNKRVAAAVGGDQEAIGEVSLLRFSSLDAPTLTLPSSGDPVVSQSITEGEVSLAQDASGGIVPLVVSFEQEAHLSMRSGRSPYDVTAHKSIEFHLLPVEADVAPAQPATSAKTSTTGTGSPTAWPTVTRNPSITWLISVFDGQITFESEDSKATPEAS